MRWRGRSVILLGLALPILAAPGAAAARRGFGEASVADSLVASFSRPKLRAPGLSRLELRLLRNQLSEADFRLTYGAFTTLGLRAVLGRPERVKMILGLAYGSQRGDPYYSGTFEGSRWAKLRLIPLELGLQLPLAETRASASELGLVLIAARVSERNPAALALPDEPPRTRTGWQSGFRVALVQSWFPDAGSRGVGLELAVGRQGFPSFEHGLGTESMIWSLGLSACRRFEAPAKEAPP